MDSFLLHLFLILFSISSICLADNTLRQAGSIRDGVTLISEGKKFELGFFSPVNSTNRYLGIWYHEIPVNTFIWVANREKPISGRGGVLNISGDGNLQVLDGNNFSVWSTNVSVGSANSSAVLKDNGDFILSISNENDSGEKVLWQSFNEPTDTYLPEMRVFYGDVAESRVFTSWRSENDPSPGNFSMGVDPRQSPQIIIWNGTNRYWRSGHWNGLVFIGIPSMRFRSIFLYGFKQLNEGNKSYFTYTLSNSSDRVRFKVRWDGSEEQSRWDEDAKEWEVLQSQPENECYRYNRCGRFGKCDIRTNPICICLQGFVPKDEEEWKKGNWSGGCIRRTELQCQRNGTLVEGGGEGDGFLSVRGVKLPDFLDYLGTEGIESCRQKCLRNCSCVAYACVTGINCMMWSRELVDIMHFQEGGETLHIRLDKSELDSKKNKTKVVIIVVVVVGTFFLIASFWLLWRFKWKRKEKPNTRIWHNEVIKSDASKSRDFSTDLSVPTDLSSEVQEGGGPEIPLFSYFTIIAATDEFSDSNKLGQGGFGPVYKGKLPCGQEIAVKRLSRRSGQGLAEFKTELTLIAKLQHRNLVKLLGYCIQGDEKMLLYEYMPNKSLDFFLFDPAKQGQLDWMKRYMIIEGIARGLLYLHRDSRLRIIHRDLKASNILLDEDMNPKISDFGMARIFGGNQNEANTNRVVGTYGYMAPEYAMEGLFSVKSDVYSFGVLLLEIISGKRNTSFRSREYSNIVGYAWSLWEGNKALDLIDPSMMDSRRQDQILRCIHVGMLCVQDLAIHRPNMQSVMLMLESEGVSIPTPRQPTFTSMRSSVDAELWNSSHEIASSGTITITEIIGR